MRLALVLLAACNSTTPPSAPAPTLPSAAPAVASVVTAFHYDLALAIEEGTTVQQSSFSLDISDRVPGSISFGKNVLVNERARSDVGALVKGVLVVQDGVPRLEVDAAISSVNAQGKIVRVTPHAVVPTAIGASTIVFDVTQDGRRFRLLATPTPSADLGPVVKNSPPYTVDVVVSPSSTFPLSITSDAPAIAKKGETVPLAGDAGPRIDVGQRVKATAHAHEKGLELDFDLEMSSNDAGTIRKIHAQGPINAPFDAPAIAFRGEEGGQRYEVKLVAHK